MDKRSAADNPSGEVMEVASQLPGSLALVPNNPAKGLRRLLNLRDTSAASGGCKCTADVDCDRGEGVTVLWRD